MTPPLGTDRSRLRKVRLRNVALVDRPAAQYSSVVLFKRAPSLLDFNSAFDLLKAKKPKLGTGQRFARLVQQLARKITKDWDESQHPRDDSGRFAEVAASMLVSRHGKPDHPDDLKLLSSPAQGMPRQGLGSMTFSRRLFSHHAVEAQRRGLQFHIFGDGRSSSSVRSRMHGGGTLETRYNGSTGQFEHSIAKSVQDPGALAAFIGRQKFGTRRFQQLATRGRRAARSAA